MSLTRGFRSKTARDGNNTKQLKHTRDCEHCAHNYKAVERIRRTIIGKYLLQSPISILVSNYMLIEDNMGDSNRIIIYFFFWPCNSHLFGKRMQTSPKNESVLTSTGSRAPVRKQSPWRASGPQHQQQERGPERGNPACASLSPQHDNLQNISRWSADWAR